MNEIVNDTFKLNISVEYDVEKLDGDPDDLYEVAKLEENEWSEYFERMVKDTLPEGSVKSVSIKISPQFS